MELSLQRIGRSLLQVPKGHLRNTIIFSQAFLERYSTQIQQGLQSPHWSHEEEVFLLSLCCCCSLHYCSYLRWHWCLTCQRYSLRQILQKLKCLMPLKIQFSLQFQNQLEGPACSHSTQYLLVWGLCAQHFGFSDKPRYSRSKLKNIELLGVRDKL